MNYPVWNIPVFGSSLLMIIVAITHVYVAHFAIGGGLFLVLAEAKGHRENNVGIIEFVKSHSRFFLLLTMVFGAVSGVGIWFTIAVIAPAATSTLIHSFVFAWAIEWVFFAGEIVALFVYANTFGRLSAKKHMQMGWLYFIFAWLSLFAVNGIITMMLTPGEWIHDRSFWTGFFNPSMLPSLVFRSFLAFMLAGLFGFLTATRISDETLRNGLLRYCAKWLFIPLVLMAASGVWYLNAIPGGPRALIMGRSPEMPPLVTVLVVAIPVIVLIGIAIVLRIPPAAKRILAFVLLLVGLAYMGAFEWIREGARRPYVIPGHTYSNGIRVGQEEELLKNGYLATAKWVKNKTITDENRLDAGRELFVHQCQSCHTVGGIRHDIVPLTAKYDFYSMNAKLDGLGKLNRYMPRFFGTAEERDALARYLVGVLQEKDLDAPEPQLTFPSIKTSIPPFDKAQSSHTLLGWSQRGMFCYMGENRFIEGGHSGASFEAQLIKRGESPEIVTETVDVLYSVEENKGAFTGKMVPNEEEGTFAISGLPLQPYGKGGGFNPYPTVKLEARKKGTREVVAESRFVLPVSTELGCKNCHGKNTNAAEKIAEKGVPDHVAKDILAVHDRIEGTSLLKSAKAGEKVKCKSCHAAISDGKNHTTAALNFSASIHGWHANFLTGQGTEACAACHASSETSHTQLFRGYHAEMGFDCTSCHGTMEDHALSLLRHEKEMGRSSAPRLMAYLRPRKVDSLDKVVARKPWTDQPDCLNCHKEFQPPETFETFNHWTEKREQLFYRRTDDVGLKCGACHGSPHAVYPAANPYGENRDNIPPLQVQGEAAAIGANGNCAVCHKTDMEDSIHHPNMK